MKSVSYLMLVISIVISVSIQAKENANKNVVMVLDASGSMWGRIKGKAKINIARGVVKDMLTNWDKNTKLGLIAYGHRRKGDCNDIQTLIPISKVNSKSFMSTLNAIQPKGKTPIGAAVQKAADSLKYTEETATVILVSDGIETCGMDPCKLGAALKKKGVDFKTHVIGFDIKSKKAVAQLKCLAKSTGGQYFSAKDASGLKKAMVKTIKIVKKAKPVVVQPKPMVKDAELQGIKLQSIATEGAEPLDKGVTYSIYSPEKDLKGNRKRLNYWGGQGTMIRKLKAGKYYVVASYGVNASAAAELEVHTGKLTTHTFNLNVGSVRLNGTADKDSDHLKKGITYSIFYPEKDLKGKRKRVSYWGGQGTMIRSLRAGKYFVTATYGVNGYAEAELEVKANQLTDFVYNLNVGTVRLNGTAAKDSDPLKKGITYSIYYPKKDLHGKRKRVNYWGGQGLMIRSLKAGKYFITATYGVNGYAEAELEVKPNQLTDFTYNLNVGTIRLKGTASNGSDPLEKGITYSIYSPNKDLQGKRKRINYWGGQGMTIRSLKAGKYFVTATYGINGYAEAELEVKPNELQDHVFNLDVGTLKISSATAKEAAAHANGNTFSIYYPKKDLKGNRTRINYWNNQGTMIRTLKAGKYHVVTKRANATVESDIVIEANKVLDLKVVIK